MLLTGSRTCIPSAHAKVRLLRLASPHLSVRHGIVKLLSIPFGSNVLAVEPAISDSTLLADDSAINILEL